MANEKRIVCYDRDLNMGAYRFEGITQDFPKHFHDEYVIGFVEKGRRSLLCNGREYCVGPGDVILFNPGDNHNCCQLGREAFDYRSLNIRPAVFRRLASEILGREGPPAFDRNVLYQSDLASSLGEVHSMILRGEKEFVKEELLFFLFGQLIAEASGAVSACTAEEPLAAVRAVCEYLEANFSSAVSLNDLSACTDLSKYHLLRSFTRVKGISPYSYLEAVRINAAKKLLEQGLPLVEVSMSTGFGDQSHFTNYFKRLTGITPGQYRLIFKHEQGVR
jgi:AraC-like DNA-binding protein